MFITIRQQIKFVEIFSGKLRPYWRTISQFYHYNLNFFRQVIRENLSDQHKNYKTLLIGTLWITPLMVSLSGKPDQSSQPQPPPTSPPAWNAPQPRIKRCAL